MTAWRDPVEVLSALGDRPWTAGFVSGAMSYVAADPDRTLVISPDDRRDPFEHLAALSADGAMVAGLACYELGDRVERLRLARSDGWPDLACARYPAVLAFDHQRRSVTALGSRQALAWLDLPVPAPGGGCTLSADDSAIYEAAVAEVVGRIVAGEIFQANIARRWRGRLADGARPVDLLVGLARSSPAPFASYLRLPDRAVVSNSPERFCQVLSDGSVTTQPIKGTARRGCNVKEDQYLIDTLRYSEKDRAENLMIVDLMRNDLARVCPAGSVAVPGLFEVESFANVHHLVSTVTGRLEEGKTAADLLRAAFPPGSITGAPKVQAMKVIAGLEAARGPFFGSMFHMGLAGAFDSNVLIRTAAFVRDTGGWNVEARAGAGIVADSDPATERAETEAKISAILAALALA